MKSLLNRTYPESLAEVREARTLEDTMAPVREISPSQPLQWLAAGWRDLWQAPAALLHGAFLAVIGAGLAWITWSQPWVGFVAMTGLFLIAPVLAVGVNHMGHLLDRQEPVGLRSGFSFHRAVRGPVWGFAGLLAAVFVTWASFVWLWIGVLNVGNANLLGPAHEMIPALLSSAAGVASLAGVLLAGAAFALLAFALSLVTIPALMDRHAGLLDALGISLKAIRHNFRPVLVWGAAITGLGLVSIATAFLALTVVFPWLGFAMWHGYRDLVAAPAERAPATS